MNKLSEWLVLSEMRFMLAGWGVLGMQWVPFPVD